MSPQHVVPTHLPVSQSNKKLQPACGALKSPKTTKIIRIHPLESMNVWTKFHGNQSDIC